MSVDLKHKVLVASTLHGTLRSFVLYIGRIDTGEFFQRFDTCLVEVARQQDFV